MSKNNNEEMNLWQTFQATVLTLLILGSIGWLWWQGLSQWLEDIGFKN